MDKNVKLSVVGLIISIAGTLGTIFQIFGERVLWITITAGGTCILLYYLFREAREIAEVVATFSSRWRLQDGRLRIGNTINVALRAKTIQVLLESFEHAFSNKVDYWDVIKNAGLSIGESFASDLRAELIALGENRIIKAGRTEDLIKDKLELWSRYDSSTGMGIFLVDSIHFANGILQGTISVKNSFLSYDKHTAHQTCAFLEGYMKGIILHLLDMQVAVKEIACSSTTGEGVCIFDIRSSPNHSVQ